MDVYGLYFTLYIIFGTNLLTGGPARIAIFLPIQCFKEKEYQTESKRNKTFGGVVFGTNAIQKTWSGCQEAIEEATRVEGTPPYWARPLSRGPLGRPPTYFFLLYIPTDPENIRGHHETQFPPA